ncbi:MAG: energy transducer TonB [Candidatus Eisenbacteria bacterium]
MTASTMPGYARLRLESRRWLDWGMMLAAGLHLLAFLAPPLSPPEAVRAPEKALIVFDFEDEDDFLVPLPPVPVPRPSIPIAAELMEVLPSDLADPDETILDTEIDLDEIRPARLDYRGIGTDDSESGDKEWTSFSEPPRGKRVHRPAYPELARKAGIEGRVIARVYIDEKGRVVRVEILSSPAEVFEEPVREALFRSEFYPAMQREIPVKSRLVVPFEFFLR